jgi:hypothetical protein
MADSTETEPVKPETTKPDVAEEKPRSTAEADITKYKVLARCPPK